MTTFPTKLRCFPSPVETTALVSERRCERVRGIDWVLRWAAAIAVLCVATVLLLNFAYRVAAEQALARAAAAGNREATLPHATSHTVEQAIRRELGGCFRLGSATGITLRFAGQPVKGVIAERIGDRFTVTLSAPVDAALPTWLSVLSPRSQRLMVATKTAKAG
jgi:hypothetical protein